MVVLGGGVEFEVGGPVFGPSGEELDAVAGGGVALHEHELKGHHAVAAVVEVGDPVVGGFPEPFGKLMGRRSWRSSRWRLFGRVGE